MISTLISIIGYAFLAYISISIFFFIFPTLIWGKRVPKNPLFRKVLQSSKILKIAHRGGPRHTTQNTIEGFTKIQDITDCIEMDVCETKDKILVVHHDHHLQRTCGVEKHVDQYNFEDLPQFLAQIVLDFGVKKIVKSQKQRIPTLEQVFKKFPNMIMNIELKTPTESAMEEFVRLLHKYNRLENTIVGIRSNKNFILKKKHPEIHTFFNDKKVSQCALAYFLGFLPFFRIDESSLQIPVYSSQFEEWHIGRTPQEGQKEAKRFMLMVKIINLLTRPLIWHLKKRGIFSFGWVCNTKQSFENAVKGGFQGIMTDDPFELQKYLHQKSLQLD